MKWEIKIKDKHNNRVYRIMSYLFAPTAAVYANQEDDKNYLVANDEGSYDLLTVIDDVETRVKIDNLDLKNQEFTLKNKSYHYVYIY